MSEWFGIYGIEFWAFGSIELELWTLLGVNGFCGVGVGDWGCVRVLYFGFASDDSGYEVVYDAALGTHIWEHLALIY